MKTVTTTTTTTLVHDKDDLKSNLDNHHQHSPKLLLSRSTTTTTVSSPADKNGARHDVSDLGEKTMMDQPRQPSTVQLYHASSIASYATATIAEIDSSSVAIPDLLQPMRATEATTFYEFLLSKPRCHDGTIHDKNHKNTSFDAKMVRCQECLGQNIANDCDTCAGVCGCYCEFLCKNRPPPRRIGKRYQVELTAPQEQQEQRPSTAARRGGRLIPRIIHQSWKEPITEDKFPRLWNLSWSFRGASTTPSNSTWEYRFYTDEDVDEFFKEQIPEPIQQAYHDLLPGAFKSDLFRLSVLLIYGGVFADLDYRLEAPDLDLAIDENVGFLVPLTMTPGFTADLGWLCNSFFASAPGHPFLAQSIEFLVNKLHLLRQLLFVETLGPGINQALGRFSRSPFTVPGDLVVKPNDTLSALDGFGRTVFAYTEMFNESVVYHRLVDKNICLASNEFLETKDGAEAAEKHYSEANKEAAENHYLAGLHGVYKDQVRANEDIRLVTTRQ